MRIFNINIIFLSLLTVICTQYISSAADVVDKIVAVVDDDVITQSELNESMLPFIADYRVRYGADELMDKIDEARADALNRLIEEKLILHQAVKLKITVTEEEVEERLRRVKSNFKTEADFHDLLKDSGMTIAKLKKKYEEQIMMRKLVNSLIKAKVHITPTQIEAYYQTHIEDFSTPKVVRFKVLLLRPLPDRDLQQTEKLALQILDRIRSGEDFDLLVEEYSQGPNVDKGGDMGYMPEGSVIKEIDEAISQMEIGEISDIIKTSSGFNIVQLIDRKEPGIMSFAEVKDAISERLFQRESELTLREYVGRLREDAYIDIK